MGSCGPVAAQFGFGNVGKGMFLRSGAEERAPKKGEVEAKSAARGDMPVAFHAREHKPLSPDRQDTDEADERQGNP